jgi:hypothetical protein
MILRNIIFSFISLLAISSCDSAPPPKPKPKPKPKEIVKIPEKMDPTVNKQVAGLTDLALQNQGKGG